MILLFNQQFRFSRVFHILEKKNYFHWKNKIHLSVEKNSLNSSLSVADDHFNDSFSLVSFSQTKGKT
jgi:hypothetical protein